LILCVSLSMQQIEHRVAFRIHFLIAWRQIDQEFLGRVGVWDEVLFYFSRIC
jgi:hypothetical protein